jgi:hypothetical protein
MFFMNKLSLKQLVICFSISIIAAFPGFGMDKETLTGFFTGQLGEKLDVAFSLKVRQGHVVGSYYYLKVGEDIPVVGEVDTKGNFKFDEYGKPGKVTGTWQGKIDSANRISGIWKAADQKQSLAFSLERTGSNDIPGEPAHREIVSDGIGYRKIAVGKTGVQFPILTRYRNPAIVDAVNREIDRLTSMMRCEEGGDYDVKSFVTYAAKDIFSIYASASYYCGGPYPTNDSNMSVTFDLKTGKLIDFPSLFSNYEADKRAILKIIFSKQMARIESLVSRPEEKKPPRESEDCQDDASLFSIENLENSDFAFNFSKEGLGVQPQWPHAIEACAEKVTVPFQALQQFARPNGILARVIGP